MEQDEAAELRAALARAGIEVEVPTGWPALPDPHGDEALAAYVQRAVFSDAVVLALAAFARQGGGVPHNRFEGSDVAKVSVAGLALNWPRDMPRGFLPPAYARADPSPHRSSRAALGARAYMLDGDAEYALNRLRPVTRAALYQGERAVRLLLGALLDAVRADRIEMLHLPPDGAHHVRLPVPWLDQSGLVVDLAGGLLAPTVARQAQGLPRFMVLRLRSAAARVAEREGAPAPAKARGAKPGSHPANYGDQRRPLIEAAKALVDVKGLSIRAALIEVVKPPPRKSADDIIRVYREQMKEEDPEWFDRHVQKKGGV